MSARAPGCMPRGCVCLVHVFVVWSTLTTGWDGQAGVAAGRPG